jgi:NAD+ diphosphatase
MTAFFSAVRAPRDRTHAYWFIFDGFRLLVHEEDSSIGIPYLIDPSDLSLPIVRSQFLGYLGRNDERIACYSAEVKDSTEAPTGMAFLGLRQLFDRLDGDLLAVAGRAVQIVDWDRTHQFCGRCGSGVEQTAYERAKKCPSCGLTTYPRLSPAIIVSIERPIESGTEILLARNKHNRSGFYSVLAGFVEPGESLEACVRREVREEVGIEIDDITYFGSQPWPFPNSLMLAFTATYKEGDIRLEEEELAEADWYRAENLPQIPPPVSIARQLIDAFIAKNNHNE